MLACTSSAILCMVLVQMIRNPPRRLPQLGRLDHGPGGVLPAAFRWSTSISAKSTEYIKLLAECKSPAFLDRLVDEPVIRQR